MFDFEGEEKKTVSHLLAATLEAKVIRKSSAPDAAWRGVCYKSFIKLFVFFKH